MNATFRKKYDFDFKISFYMKLFRVILLYGTFGLVMETLEWMQ